MSPVFLGLAHRELRFWVGIGHAGTLILRFFSSSVRTWRTSINRAGRSDDDLAVICAAIFQEFTSDVLGWPSGCSLS